MKSLYVVPIGLLLAGFATAQNSSSVGEIVRLDPAFDALVPKDAKIEKVATGFTFTEGPLWRPDGVLWFSPYSTVSHVFRDSSF